MKSGLTTSVAVAMIGLAVLFGCQSDLPSTPAQKNAPPTLKDAFRSVRGDTSGCNTASGILLPDAPLALRVAGSRVSYPAGAVSVPTVVSFSLCDLNTTGTTFYPKSQVLGPISNLVFSEKVPVNLPWEDAGLPEEPIQDRGYNVFRQNEATGSWDLVSHARAWNGTLKYRVNKRNGVYAISRDSVWWTERMVGPSGSELNLNQSVLSIPPQALVEATEISFSITFATPTGLAGATNRIFDFTPEGIEFNSDVSLAVSFTDAGLDEKVYPLRFYYFDNATGVWVPQPTQIDWANQRFLVTLSHFSRYAFGR